ncbi:Elongation factor Ts [Zea mays]|uniref:Elongation factor Ts, mitochondrial n=1 Tax=Zea mays TaxID=4577 RepID=A0A3L6G1A9_MAIZE|nr:Elongation factor Ts [Zea mays]
MQREDLLTKPEQIRAKIVEGHVKKRLGEFTLFEQTFIKNDKVTISEWLKQTIATTGENMKVRRFARYNLGEGLEKKSQDFAPEVAHRQQRSRHHLLLPRMTSLLKQQNPRRMTTPLTFGTHVSRKPAIAVSASFAKQLRDETGVGMMGCKKALAESDGDLQKS